MRVYRARAPSPRSAQTRDDVANLHTQIATSELAAASAEVRLAEADARLERASAEASVREAKAEKAARELAAASDAARERKAALDARADEARAARARLLSALRIPSRLGECSENASRAQASAALAKARAARAAGEAECAASDARLREALALNRRLVAKVRAKRRSLENVFPRERLGPFCLSPLNPLRPLPPLGPPKVDARAPRAARARRAAEAAAAKAGEVPPETDAAGADGEQHPHARLEFKHDAYVDETRARAPRARRAAARCFGFRADLFYAKLRETRPSSPRRALLLLLLGAQVRAVVGAVLVRDGRVAAHRERADVPERAPLALAVRAAAHARRRQG